MPVAIRREDHFFSAAHAAHLLGGAGGTTPSGKIVGVLDVTSRSGLMQQHVLVLLGMTARMIENRLIDLRFRNGAPAALPQPARVRLHPA